MLFRLMNKIIFTVFFFKTGISPLFKKIQLGVKRNTIELHVFINNIYHYYEVTNTN